MSSKTNFIVSFYSTISNNAAKNLIIRICEKIINVLKTFMLNYVFCKNFYFTVCYFSKYFSTSTKKHKVAVCMYLISKNKCQIYNKNTRFANVNIELVGNSCAVILYFILFIPHIIVVFKIN